MGPGFELRLERPIFELELVDQHRELTVLDDVLFLIGLVVIFEHELRIELRYICIGVNELELPLQSQYDPLVLTTVHQNCLDVFSELLFL